MSSINIDHQTQGAAGRFVFPSEQGDAELTYTIGEDGEVIADHTFVPDALRGGGIAGKLVNALVATARSDGWKIVPRCSYVAAAFKRHPEWTDLLAD
ncbi:GNAT family N-acetyltransferase [Blastomonas sp.]|uniref:GNAT family N-acetyltransferase n=1 Tax=Blastomonas sp. TaxID=1909299 RepID=UPI003593AC9B